MSDIPELWRAQIELERSNMTKSGDWMELVKRKHERLEAAKEPKQKAGLTPPKPQSKRALYKAEKAKKKQRRAARAARNRLRAEWRKTLPPEQAEAKIKQLRDETKAACSRVVKVCSDSYRCRLIAAFFMSPPRPEGWDLLQALVKREPIF